MRLLLPLLLIVSCKSVSMVPFVGGSAYTTDEYAAHVGVSFVPTPEEVTPRRASFRADPVPDHVEAPEPEADRGAELDLPGAPAAEPSAADLEAAWVAYLRGRGWRIDRAVEIEVGAEASPAPADEDPERIHASGDIITWGRLEFSAYSLSLIVAAAIAAMKRKEIAGVFRKKHGAEE